MSAKPVVIIGAGLAGLCCAKHLVARGIDVLLLESQNNVGGRVRTDFVQGFRLDRGFQVLQTAYPEARQQLDYAALKLKSFEPGALIMTRGTTVRMSDPWRRPMQAFSTAFNRIGDLGDRWRLAKLRWHVTKRSIEELMSEPDSSTMDYLQTQCGFSQDMIERFFLPWFGGVFFEHELSTSSRFFKFIFRIFAIGNAALPEEGMGAITQQLASAIPPTMRRLSAAVDSLEDLRVRLKSSETIESRAIILAVEGPRSITTDPGHRAIARVTSDHLHLLRGPPATARSGDTGSEWGWYRSDQQPLRPEQRGPELRSTGSSVGQCFRNRLEGEYVCDSA